MPGLLLWLFLWNITMLFETLEAMVEKVHCKFKWISLMLIKNLK